jgi:hypothetical protein
VGSRPGADHVRRPEGHGLCFAMEVILLMPVGARARSVHVLPVPSRSKGWIGLCSANAVWVQGQARVVLCHLGGSTIYELLARAKGMPLGLQLCCRGPRDT